MRSLYDPTARQEIVTRIQSLTANNRRRWGRLELHQMLVHLGDQLRMAVGGVKVERARGPAPIPSDAISSGARATVAAWSASAARGFHDQGG